MATLDELFEAITEYPNDMPPRMVYGLQVGGERGELIALQLDLDEALKNGEISGGVVRMNQLLDDLTKKQAWANPLLPEAKPVEFYRGFVEHVKVDALWFAASAERLLRSAPIRHLDVTGLDSPEACDTFFGCGWLGMIHGLALADGFDDRALHGLAMSPHLVTLEYLWLPDGSFSDEALAAILDARPGLQMFSSLEFDEIYEADWDGSNVFISQPERAVQFELRYGNRHALHAKTRNRFASRMLF